jgi:hypothetical protein
MILPVQSRICVAARVTELKRESLCGQYQQVLGAVRLIFP